MKFDKPVIGGPCWAELGTNDLEASKRFYTDLFGWRLRVDPRPEMRGYTIAYVNDTTVAAMQPLRQVSQPVAWNVSFAVEDADEAANSVAEAGGTVITGPLDVLDEGRNVVALDPCGAAFQMWQAQAFTGAGRFNAPGALGWVELATRDVDRARDFYTRAFGWNVNSSQWYTQWTVQGEDFGGVTTMDERFPADMPPHWLPYFAVSNVNTSADKALREGGKALVEPTDVRDGPRIAVLRDPQGAPFGIYEVTSER
ncbi:VOC family protein [Streptomyces sp. NPDC003697]